jgi:hypothetical protein
MILNPFWKPNFDSSQNLSKVLKSENTGTSKFLSAIKIVLDVEGLKDSRIKDTFEFKNYIRVSIENVYIFKGLRFLLPWKIEKLTFQALILTRYFNLYFTLIFFIKVVNIVYNKDDISEDNVRDDQIFRITSATIIIFVKETAASENIEFPILSSGQSDPKLISFAGYNSQIKSVIKTIGISLSLKKSIFGRKILYIERTLPIFIHAPAGDINSDDSSAEMFLLISFLVSGVVRLTIVLDRETTGTFPHPHSTIKSLNFFIFLYARVNLSETCIS